MADMIYGGSDKNWTKWGDTWINNSKEAWDEFGKANVTALFMIIAVLGAGGILITLIIDGVSQFGTTLDFVGVGMVVGGILGVISKIFRIIFTIAAIIAVIWFVIWIFKDFDLSEFRK